VSPGPRPSPVFRSAVCDSLSLNVSVSLKGPPPPAGGGGRGGGWGGRYNEEEERAKDEAPREQGFVASLKENFGFVKHAESDKEFFFHYSEIRDADVRDFERGTEVEFGGYYDARNDKTMAVRVIILPKGTIKTEELVQTSVEGVVVRELREKRSYDRNARREMYGGAVRLLEDKSAAGEAAEGAAAEGAGAEAAGSDAAQGSKPRPAGQPPQRRGAPRPPEWQFGGDDVEPGESSRPYVPVEGDVVVFDVIKVLASRQERATNIRFVRAAPVAEVERESGFVEKVAKDSYGFIECCDRDDRLFFHFSEVNPRNHQIAPGDEVLFVVSTDNQGRHTATQIVIQPRGTVTRVLDFDGIFQGVVEKPLKIPPKKAGFTRERPEPSGGVIAMEEKQEGAAAAGVDGKGRTVKVAFDGSELAEGCKGVLPAPGDTVEFRLSLDKAKKRKFAKQVLGFRV